MTKNYLFLLILIFGIKILSAQNCSVNAGINLQICQNQEMKLVGAASGLLRIPTDVKWTQIAGPSVSITSPDSLTSKVVGFSPYQSYTFRISATCRDGVKVFDQVTYTVLPISTALAGPDQTACPGTSNLAGNNPGVNETGLWTIVGANNAGITIATPTSPTSSFTTSTSNAGNTVLRWTITNTNVCASTDDVVITNFGGVSPVAITPNSITLSKCFSSTQCYQLNGTFGGNGFGGQQGTWSQVDGPTNVTFDNIHLRNATVCGLSEGCYVIKWNVIGTCATGSDTIRICVPKPTQSVTNANFSNQVFCDGRTIASLVGSVPVYSGERVIWEKVSGPAGTSFIDSSSANNAIIGLDGTSTYTIKYTIINDTTGCSSSITRTIGYTTNPSIGFIGDTVLTCGMTSVKIPFTATGGNITYYSFINAPDSWGTAVPTGQSATGTPLSLSNMTAPGNYLVRMRRTTTNGVNCADFTQDVNVTVSIKPLGANAGTDQLLACNVTSTQLAGNQPAIGYGTWTQVSGPNTATITDIKDYETNISNLVAGVYDFKWFINGGIACPKAEDTVRIILSTAVPTAVSAGANKTVCFGGPIQLDGNIPIPGEVGVWSVTPSSGVTFNNINDPKTLVNGLIASTAYTFKWKVTNLCGVDSSTVVITTNATKGPPQAAAGADRCLASGTTSITLAGNNPSPASGLWTKLSGPSATITNDTLYNTAVTALTDGVYTLEWRNTNGTCDPTFDTVVITISGPTTIANAGTDIDSCGNSVTMVANTATVGIGTWSQFTGPAGAVVSDIHSPTARFTNLVTGSYQFIWTIKNGACASSTDTVSINIDNRPTIPTAGTGQKLCGSNSLTLTGNSITVGSASWSVLGSAPNSPTFANPNANTTLVSGLITGIYTFARTAYSLGGVCAALQDTVSDTIIISANAGADQAYCGNQSVLNLTGPQNSIGIWSKVSGGSATITPTSTSSAIVTLTNPAGSPYLFEYLVPLRFGCPATRDTLKISIDDTTKIPKAGTDKLLCTSTTVTMDANSVAPNVGTWFQIFGPNSVITDSSLYNTTVTGINTQGIYLYKWTASNGACMRADEVRIEKFDPPTTAAAGPNVTICPTKFTMVGNTAVKGAGKWFQISGPSIATILEPVNPKTVIEDLTTVGTYIFEWVITNGPVCAVSRDTMEISVPFLNPTTPNAGIDSSICVRTNSALTGNSITLGTGTWSQYTVAPTATITTPTSNTSNITLTTAGIYGFVWTATNGSCALTDTVIYTLSDLPTVSNAGADINTCIGEPIVLNGNDPSPNSGIWKQISGTNTAGYSDSTIPKPTVFGIGVGAYEFRWQITSGSCPSSNDTVKVTIVARPALAIAGADQAICTNFTNLLGSSDSVGTGTWSNVSGPNVPTITTPATSTTSVTGLTNGTYLFRWAIANGTCSSEDTVSVYYRIPEINNTCSLADSLSVTNTSSTLDSLCAATAEAGEPSTCGKPACNSLLYKFQSNPSIWFQDLDVNFNALSTCSNGLRVSLFENGACPGLGAQLGTCQTISAVGTLTFASLKPSTVYYLVVDDNSATCGASTCQFEFSVGGHALPLEMISFNAEIIGENMTHLTWKTATEINTKSFEILRKTSSDIDFVKVGSMPAAGNSNKVLNYSAFDDITKLPNEPIFYKIRVVDNDGTSNNTNTVKVQKKSTSINDIKVYPNPTTKSVTINLNMVNLGNVSIEITDATGRVVKSKLMTNVEGLVLEELNMDNLSPGVYNVTFKSGNTNYSEKLILIK